MERVKLKAMSKIRNNLMIEDQRIAKMTGSRGTITEYS